MKRFLTVTFLALTLAGCNRCSNSGNDKLVTAEDPEKVNKLVTESISDNISKADTAKPYVLCGDTLLTTGWMKTFYGSHANKSAWSDKGKLTATGDSMLQILKNAADWGLIPEDYHGPLIDSLLRTAFDSTKETVNVTHLSQADLLLTDAFFTFAVHVSTGRMDNDTSLTREWHPKRLDTNVVALLDDALKRNRVRQVFESIEPKAPEYKAVKKYLAAFRKEFGKAKWEELPDIDKDSAAFFKALRPRLIASKDYDSSGTDSDSLKLANALRHFQKRFGLEPDGKAGKLTRKALAMNVEDRLRQMAVNLERWRIEPKDYGKRYLFVNIPSFEMKVIEEDTLVMKSRIVVGAPKTQTPQLSSKITFMILYPYWNVPYSIAWKEILPAVKRDTNYLHKKNFDVIDHNGNVIPPSQVNWKKLSKSYLPYKFRQRIGEDNSLGVLKFDFANKYGVYMHDTNSKRFFTYENRAQSHGCMRLEKYMDLAHFLIREDSVKLPKDTFDVYLKQQTQRRVYVRKPLPIYVRYFTCYTNADGQLLLLNDLYDRDDRIMHVLYDAADRKKGRKIKTPAPQVKVGTVTAG